MTIEKAEVISKMSGSTWLKGIDGDKLAKIVELSSINKYKSDEFVYMVGDTLDSIFCVIDGQVKVSIIEPLGEEFVLTIWEHGSWFGEGAMQNDELGMPVEVRAKTDATILVVPIAAIDKVLEDATVFYKNIVLDMVSRSKLLFKLVEILLFRPLQARVAMRVLHLVEHFGEPNDEGIVLPMKFSQSDFARMSGGSRQRVNRIFRQWADDGVVTKRRGHYTVHDIAALQAELDRVED